jgi:hypothetical protein
MKPVAPRLALEKVPTEEPSLHAEILRLCDETLDQEDQEEGNERITLPAPPPSPETLRMATPYPPPDERSLDTIPAPPPSNARKRMESEVEAVPSTIPGPPPVPRIAGM